MNILPFRRAAATAAALLLSVFAWQPSYGQDRPKKAWEIGAGGSALNYTRMSIADFTSSGDGFRFNLKDMHLFGGGSLSVSRELAPWLWIDAQGILSTARYDDEDGSESRGFAWMAGPGLQLRPFTRSRWIEPYLRVGVSAFKKDFPVRTFGGFDGDVTGEGSWTMVKDAWNEDPSDTQDLLFPLCAGVGIIGWMSERVGIAVQGDYVHQYGDKGRSFAKADMRLILRFGGVPKRSSAAAPVTNITFMTAGAAGAAASNVVEKIVEVEVPVERIVEKIIEVPSDKVIYALMENVNFAFDSDILTQESLPVLDGVASIINGSPGTNYLVSGHTDARGSVAHNEDLSVRRAKAVYYALISRGVSESRLAWRGFGSRIAVVPAGASERDRLGDRKVTVTRISDPNMWKYLK